VRLYEQGDLVRVAYNLPADRAWTLTPCRADWLPDDAVDSEDFFAFVTDFFAGRADFDQDGAVNTNDFFAFLGAFFEGCP
jgi:hypothetical protein